MNAGVLGWSRLVFATDRGLRISQRGAWLVLVLTVVFCVGGAQAASLALPLPADDTFNVLRWEAQHLPNKWLYLGGRVLRGRLSKEEEAQRLERYFLVSALLQRIDPRDPRAATQLDGLRAERDELENDVEAIIEGRVTAVLDDLGLETALPFFPQARFVFPPVDFEFDRPLQVVAVSPRDRIELIDRRPLRLDVTSAEIERIERAIEASGRRSALAEPVGGAATYPSIVAHQADYQTLVATVAHEWVHQYLAFRPLGQRYFASLPLQTVNETVADLVGEEIASIVVLRFPLAPGVAAELERGRAGLSEEQVGARLRTLRLEVDALLGDGRIAEAEALMERRRQELAEDGVEFRRINQAFFAARNVYATDPTSLDPIGRMLQTLRERSPSLAAFLRTTADFTSAADLERALEKRPTAGDDRGRR